MAASDGFAAYLREQLAPLGHVALRRMFSSTGVFCHDVMFGLVRDDTLYFRVDAQTQGMFQDAGSTMPFRYRKGGRTIDLAFWQAPERLLDEPEELVAWARAALAAARRVAAARGRPRRRAAPRGPG